MKISTEDRSALLLERVVVHAIHDDEFGTRMYVTGPDEARAREVVGERLGDEIEITVCGDEPREILPRRCYGHMEREPGRLQLRYALHDEEHVNEIVVAEDDAQVVVFGTICAPMDLDVYETVGHPYHHRLDQPLGDREVIDAVTGVPVPLLQRLRRDRGAGGEDAVGQLGTSARFAILLSVSGDVMNRAERSLLDAIAAGELDDHLDALAAAVGARRELLHTVRSATRLMSLCEGDLVRINQRISPRYLAGLHGDGDRRRSRRRDDPARAAGGRFDNGRVRVPPLALDKLSSAA